MTMTYMKNGETLSLDGEACVGCGECVNVCPHAVFRIELGKASIHTRAACMECGACARNCPVGALVVKAGVGCAGAIIIGKLRGTAPDCGGGSCGGSTTSCC
ncbi:MAG TPA: mercury methylation ferredoxin HgcB [Rectinemataceae bacterium]|nr:mercury methylation ferredoxin HgcB [Rectinemataceae bacterium]